jgi:hypothetical protein
MEASLPRGTTVLDCYFIGLELGSFLIGLYTKTLFCSSLPSFFVQMLLELALLLPGSSPSGKVPFRPPWLPELEIPGAFAGLVPPPMPIPKEHE